MIDHRTGEELLDLGDRPISAGSRSAAFNPAGVFAPDRYLAVAFEAWPTGGTVEVHDVPTGRLVATLEPQADKPLTVAFDPTGRYLAVGTRNGRAQVLDLTALVDGAPVDEALAFDQVVDSGAVASVDLDAEGVLATSAYGSLRLWDSRSGRMIADLAIDVDLPPQATFDPDGTSLYYVDALPTGFALRRFPRDIDELVALAERRLTRGLTDEECRRYLRTETCPAR